MLQQYRDWRRQQREASVQARLARLERILLALTERFMVDVQQVKEKLQAVIDSVAAEKTLEQSLIVLAKGLSTQVGDLQQQLATAIANSDFSGLAAVADGLDALKTGIDQQAADIAAAVTADTPAAPATPAPPVTDTGIQAAQPSA